MEKSLSLLCMRHLPTSRCIGDGNFRYLTQIAGSRALPSKCVSPKKVADAGRVAPPCIAAVISGTAPTNGRQNCASRNCAKTKSWTLRNSIHNKVSGKKTSRRLMERLEFSEFAISSFEACEKVYFSICQINFC